MTSFNHIKKYNILVLSQMSEGDEVAWKILRLL
jgi:hypothetical protein